ncbi:MAG: hypothetical protein KTR31_15450 [Myxococcales bacterium]|nr:hypothetical protein [Myxococcales bacterium]
MIRIRGARQNNLAAFDLDLPTRQLVVLCGVSGSGKSSLAFDTVHAEGQRRYLEAMAVDRLVTWGMPPRVDQVEGLPPTVALGQRHAAASRRATVSTVLDLDPVLRVLFARAGVQHCPRCDREIRVRTHDEIVAQVLSRPEGSRLTLEAPLRQTHAGILEEVERAGFSRLRLDDRVVRLDEARLAEVEGAASVRIVVDRLKVSPDRRDRLADSVRLAATAGQGVLIVRGDDDQDDVMVDRPLCWYDDLRLPALEPSLLSPLQPPGACPACEGTGTVAPADAQCGACEGTRLSSVARAVRWRGSHLGEVRALSARALLERVAGLPEGEHPVEALVLPDVRVRLERLASLRLHTLPLDRRADQLSGSELQRLRLARQLANPLSGVCYVLDEPAAGLDREMAQAVVQVIRQLVDGGNSVLAVAHAPEVIRAADHVVEFGPGAGAAGGKVVFQGTVDALMQADTPTGRWLSGRSVLPAPETAREGADDVVLDGPWRLGRTQRLVLPRARVVAVTGPSGSGKSTLLATIGAALQERPLPEGVTLTGVEGLSRSNLVGRGASKSGRSNPATYVGLWDVLRELLAATRESRVRGLSASTFSLNTKGGRCAACAGSGEEVMNLGPLPDLVLPCRVCEGRRFEQDVLEVRWKGLDPSEILALRAAEAQVLLAGHPHLDRALRALVRVGLGYVPLGQATRTLSGGEAMRLSLARELSRAARRGAADTVYLLDDPTTGLHPQDVAHLLQLLRELVDDGATVWMATSDEALAAVADVRVELPAI